MTLVLTLSNILVKLANPVNTMLTLLISQHVLLQTLYELAI